MAKMPHMVYEFKNGEVIVTLPLTSRGKFRCKKRNDIQDFGKGFAPKTEIIPSNAYLEWQIGYDTIIGKDEKDTKLKKKDFVFKGANTKDKHPYELSEILFLMCKQNIIAETELDDLLKKINNIKCFLEDQYQIEVKKENKVALNGVIFLSSSTKLPTFIKKTDNSNFLIEIMIEKQQYGTGVQPMLYLDVPVDAFVNSKDIINHTSKEVPNGFVSFNKSNKKLISDLFECFGMLSKDHNHDVNEILEVIKKNAYR